MARAIISRSTFLSSASLVGFDGVMLLMGAPGQLVAEGGALLEIGLILDLRPTSSVRMIAAPNPDAAIIRACFLKLLIQ
jgi:hypothetical protein